MGAVAIPLFGAMNSILASASQPARFQTLTVSSANPLLIADKTLAYDATALLTAGSSFVSSNNCCGFFGKSLW
jgi:hypothetical protein